MVIPKQPRLLPRRQAILHRLMASPHWWRHLYSSLVELVPTWESSSLCRRWEVWEHWALNGMSPSNPSPQGSGSLMEEGMEWARGMEDTKKTRPSKSTWSKLLQTQRDGGSRHRSAPDPLCAQCGFQLSVRDFLSMGNMWVCFLPSLGLISFCFFFFFFFVKIKIFFVLIFFFFK